MQKVTDNIFLLLIFAMTGTFILASSFVFFFLRYQRRMLQQKEAMQKAELEHGENLLRAALQSQEEERKRIGRDLHDDVGAALSNLRMVMAKPQEPGSYKPLIDNIIGTVRSISHSLAPPGLELFGLDHTLHELSDTFNTSGSLQVVYSNNAGGAVDKLEKNTALALYRVIQELLSNTIKHAGATTVSIVFYNLATHLELLYKDDGKGMDMNGIKKAGMGLQNIEGRLRMAGATYTVNTSSGNGFNLTIKLHI